MTSPRTCWTACSPTRKPVICGVSATYLYQNMRETADNQENDIIGQPVGHFVVVSGWDSATRTVTISDPQQESHLRNGNLSSALHEIQQCGDAGASSPTTKTYW